MFITHYPLPNTHYPLLFISEKQALSNKFQISLDKKAKNSIFAVHNQKCESSSVGRARPCQGRGREFESRLSLQKPLSREDFF